MGVVEFCCATCDIPFKVDRCPNCRNDALSLGESSIACNFCGYVLNGWTCSCGSYNKFDTNHTGLIEAQKKQSS
jgi:predicted amidophosphoribosyltransferase